MINYNAIANNAQFFKEKSGKAKLCAVLKNNAYGHDIEKTAKILCNIADCFAVGNVDEADKIKPFGKPILILLPLFDQDIIRAVLGGYVITVDSFETLERVHKVAKQLSVTALVHLKIDTGMHRLGFLPDMLEEVCKQLKSMSFVQVDGIFSHFCRADCDPSFTQKQFDLFCESCIQVEKLLNKTLIKHIANTAGIMLDCSYSLDMVRIGIGLYGYGAKGLLPAKEIKAKVVAIRKVDKNDSLGYGFSGKVNSNCLVAVVNIGYADGLARCLSNKICFLINGKRYRQIGAICMAMCMLQVDDTVKTGDEVVVLGSNNFIATDDVIIYELLCNLGEK